MVSSKKVASSRVSGSLGSRPNRVRWPPSGEGRNGADDDDDDDDEDDDGTCSCGDDDTVAAAIVDLFLEDESSSFWSNGLAETTTELGDRVVAIKAAMHVENFMVRDDDR